MFSDFKENKAFLKDIPLQFIPIITSKYFKYNFGDYGMVCNFETDLPFDEVREYTQIVLENIVEQYFIIEHPDNMGIHMPNNLKLNLFDLETDNKNYDTDDNMSEKPNEHTDFSIEDFFLNGGLNRIDFRDMSNMEDDFFIDEDEDDPIIFKLRMKQKAKDARPSLDQLLDKIKETGIKSLTKYENQLLDEYAKK